ncbi:MAG TPA: hypothetical protein VGB85_18895 [Nannocystis sp.]
MGSGSRSIRSLAAEAGVPVEECLDRLRAAGIKAGVGAQKLDGQALASAQAALGVRARLAEPTPTAGRRDLEGDELLVRLLRPLREKGKVGRDHTTSVEHVWGHGLPDHQKAEAKRLVEALLTEGCLDEKVSQGRRQLWLTNSGLERLSRAEAVAAASGAPSAS